MKMKILKWLIAACCAILAACAIITVNVYFPEKDVKQAYKSLDEMLLNQGDIPVKGEQPPPQEPKQGEKPHSGLIPFQFVLLPEAAAQESNISDNLAVELSMMPEVLAAYDEMRVRLPRLNGLRESGIVGETFQGLVSVRDKSRASEAQPLVEAENKNRKVVITGMARAIIKNNKMKETKEALKQLLPQSAASYAAIRKEEAKPGWWLLVAPDRWVQK
jgi:uncharacterized protein YdbL (DUF1318 family)